MALLPKVKLKAVVSFPATVLDGTGVDVVKQNGTYQFNIAFDDFAPPVTGLTDPTHQNVLVWNSVTNAYVLVPTSIFLGSTTPSAANPLMDGAAAPGTALPYSREDHVHPTDTSRAPLASPTFTGDPKAPTPTAGDNDTSIATTAFVSSAVTASVAGVTIRSYLAGLTLSTAGSSATFGIAAGVATDSSNAAMMALASAYTKTTGAWAVGSGNGALDTGTIGAASWYHVFLIRRPDTGVVDVLVSLSATAPTLPGGGAYTQFRRIGSMKTASSQWVAFTQLGDEFLLVVPTLDISATTIGTTSTLYTMNVPLGVQTTARVMVDISVASASLASVTITSPDQATLVSGAGNINVGGFAGGATSNRGFGEVYVRTNTSQQIRAVAFTASSTLSMTTTGWIDRRGRDA